MQSAKVEFRRAAGSRVSHFGPTTAHAVDASADEVANTAVHADEHGGAANEHVGALLTLLGDFSDELVARQIVGARAVGQSNRLNDDGAVLPTRRVQTKGTQPLG